MQDNFFVIKFIKMFLKSLSLRGFKTFAEKVELNFLKEGGIAAVVGPNGCGKSNIVDAFRFALGEGNFRELRVNSLPEVIFAGTDMRKPLSLAEVTLTFDNSSGVLPVDYLEVAVKRRTFKDGTSEFYINRQPCRLKDIRNLFLDTGVSCESLSIIGQGRVDSILSSRPEERRAFFEEVAGIHKYKTRKLEVERKLILCEQNLLRISDLKVEIGEQALMLEAQASKAKEYKTLQARLHDLEVGVFKKQVLGLLSKIEEVEARISELKKQALLISEQTQKTLDEKAKLRERSRWLEAEIEASRRMAEEIKEEIKSEQSSLLIEHERRVFEEKNKVRDLVEEGRFVKFEISRLENSAKSILSKKDEVKKQIEEWSESDSAELRELQPIVQVGLKLVEQINSLARVLCGREGIVLRSHAEDKVIEMFRAEMKKLEEEEMLLNDGLKAKKEELHKTEEKESRLKKGIEEMQAPQEKHESEEISKLKNKSDELQAKLDKLKEEKAQCQKILEDLENKPASGPGGSEELMREEIALAKFQGELLQLDDRMQGDYSLSREALLSQPLLAENVARSKKEAEEIKFRLRSLEPVNLLAIDEYEKAKERHGFIESQYVDLVSARENLKSLITELDAKAAEDFSRTMEVVTKNFKEIFSSLFEGGEASIEVNEDEGIEISACPSGRKWLNLSLLSGGERALTAIALLLSFLKTQPSPLCILDEVDAALDEANVSRFARFIKQFAGKTQMLVISHNKRTMEAADIIYGITMEEPGVSKVVSMRLAEAV